MTGPPSTADWTNGTPVILLSRCRPCGHRWYLRRTSCPRCGATDIGRVPALGPGKVVAVTVVHRRAEGGGATGIALVELVEGVRAMVRCAADTIVGQTVTVGVVDESFGSGGPALVPAVL